MAGIRRGPKIERTSSGRAVYFRSRESPGEAGVLNIGAFSGAFSMTT